MTMLLVVLEAPTAQKICVGSRVLGSTSWHPPGSPGFFQVVFGCFYTLGRFVGVNMVR